MLSLDDTPGLKAQIYVLGNKIRSCIVLRLWLASKDVRRSDTRFNTDGFDNELFAEITPERLMDGFEEDGAPIQTDLYASVSKRGHMWCYRLLLFTSALAIIILLVVYDPPIALEASYFHGSRQRKTSQHQFCQKTGSIWWCLMPLWPGYDQKEKERVQRIMELNDQRPIQEGNKTPQSIPPEAIFCQGKVPLCNTQQTRSQAMSGLQCL